jgi:hypothetical protein
MAATIATEHGLRSARADRTAYGLPRLGSVQIILAVWIIAVLLIAAHAGFGAQSAFLGAFDVSVAAF